MQTPQALRKQWRESFGGTTKPHDFIDWLLVAHAATHAASGDSVNRLAHRVGVGRHVLGAAFDRRLPNTSVQEVIAEGPEVLLANLKDLLSGSSTTKSDRTKRD